MSKNIILYIATSLDGFIARKDGSVDWLSPYEKGPEDYGYNEFYKKIGTVIMGNNTSNKFYLLENSRTEARIVLSLQGIRIRTKMKM